MAERVLTLREINRMTLARQMLLKRETVSVTAVLERLVGMQAQLPQAPYIGLWTRLPDFQRRDLADLIVNHTVIKVTLMRATLHLVTADDYRLLRGALRPALEKASGSIVEKREQTFELDEVLEAARLFIDEAPRSFAEISDMLAERWPEVDVGSMRYSVRTHLPLVQVPTNTGWSYPGNPKFALAETWLGKPIPTESNLDSLIFRYLAAFGPATVADIQTWSGLGKLKEAVEKLKPGLRVYRDEKKRELFDLPDMPPPDGDVPAPERFLPEFDNLLLSHSDRRRVVADEYRSRVYLPALRVAATFLVDGFVAGAWKVEKMKGAATLNIEPFAPLPPSSRAALADEGERLVRFMEPDAKSYEVRFGE
jgi:hypothetical protein